VRAAWTTHDGAAALAITGFDEDALAALRQLSDSQLARHVRVMPSTLLDTGVPTGAPASRQHLEPTRGTWILEDNSTTFVPRFAFLAGCAYTALVHRTVVDGGIGQADLDLDLDQYLRVEPGARPGGRPDAATEVLAIHPTIAFLPRNALRLYVQFSARMSEGEAAAHLRIVDAHTRTPLDGALLDLEPELWDPDRRRLTVLFDPARIKRGLVPHEEAGYPLVAGRAISVVVDREFRDASGHSLHVSASRDYEIGDDVRALVDPTEWTIDAPRVGDRAPLLVRFDRPLDHALVQHCLTVTDARGSAIPGVGASTADASVWAFVPTLPWVDASCALTIDPMLEDLAGNSCTRVFDRELADPRHAPRSSPSPAVTFRPRSTARRPA
jgi:hypothetical protein